MLAEYVSNHRSIMASSSCASISSVHSFLGGATFGHRSAGAPHCGVRSPTVEGRSLFNTCLRNSLPMVWESCHGFSG